MKHITSALLAIGFCVGCSETPRSSSSPATTSASATAKRDNTEVNVRDRDKEAKTPLDQNENKTDVDITAKIRREVVDTKMSVNAQNVKIITQGGKVTLRGPVKSDEEKKRVEEIAQSVAGAGNVDSHIEVESRP